MTFPYVKTFNSSKHLHISYITHAESKTALPIASVDKVIVVCAPLAIIKIYTYLFYNFDLEAVLYYRHQWLLARRVEHALLDTALEPGTRIDKHCKQCDMKM